jgi:hypothetical protein
MMLQTFTRRSVNPLAPRVQDIAIEDIAHALAHVCRFGGHVSSFYSVAQHSVLASRQVEPADALWALLHDASEAYLGDIPTPLKRTGAFRDYHALEALWQRTIYQRFGLTGEEPAGVATADLQLLLAEADVLLPGGPLEWVDSLRGRVAPASVQILPVLAPQAEAGFLKRFHALTATV